MAFGTTPLKTGEMSSTLGLLAGCMHRFMLVLTLTLVICELVVSRLCSSLINMVDCFHTLFILLHMTLLYMDTSRRVPVSPLTNPYNLSAPVQCTPQPTVQTTSHTNRNSTALPNFNSCSSSPEAHAAPVLSCAGFCPENGAYNSRRIQPFGSLISALLLASLCASITLEIISQTLQPHPIQRPLLAAVVGAVSLLFNILVLAISWNRHLDVGFSWRLWKKDGTLSTLDDKALAGGEVQSAAAADAEGNSNICPVLESTLQDGPLMFCNPAAPAVLDPNVDLSSSIACPDRPAGCSLTLTEPNHQENSVSHSSGVSRQWSGAVRVVAAVIQGLLSSVLVLTNGLAQLLSGHDCLHSQGVCHLLVYLDPGFSILTVFMLLAIALPDVYRYGLLLLQATPACICTEKLATSIAHVPGVFAVHELHVWQLTEACVIASVHIHCKPEFEEKECSDLMTGVTKVLHSAGISHCTVQPEFLAMETDCTLEDTAATGPQRTSALPICPPCSLSCGKDCADRMCCSPREECPLAPSSAHIEDKSQVMIIANTFL